MERKIFYQFIIIAISLTFVISAISLYNSKNNSLKSSIHNAEQLSEVIKNGLTAHMINANMDQVDTYINSITSVKNITKFWVVRNASVEEQYGIKEKNKPRDNIDKKVLETGQIEYQLNEKLFYTNMRITIPYKVVLSNGVNCINCHNASQGDTLGAISMELNMSEIKNIGLETIYLIPIMMIIGVLLIFYIFRKKLNQYSLVFNNLSKSLNFAANGQFKKIPYPEGLSKDMIILMDKFNDLMTSFKNTATDIDKKLKGFIGTKINNQVNPLEDSKEIVLNLSNLYQFKKEIELDNTKEEIYNRLSEIFINQFNFKNFTFIEIDTSKQKMSTIKEVGNSFYCKHNIENEPHLCRAARTKNDVISTEFHHTCPYFEEVNKFHYCISTAISKNVYLIINFVFDNKEELDYLKDKISYIKSYINESAPSIEVKFLMDALQQSAFRDGLTGLYNRKFLEEHSKKLIPQAIRDKFSIGVLLLDMDHFKAVNDEYGHDIGDKVLKELSRILNETVRESDIIIRYGGEEFIVLLVNVNTEEDALVVANKIRMRVSENEIDVYAGSKLRKTISIGLSMFPDDSNSLETVIKNADIALYDAKSKGRNKVVRFHSEQTSSIDLF
jgi:two-component system, cell cycle response regulator